MNNTLKTLSTIITPEYNEMNLEQLAEVYTEELNPSILATAFSKTFKLIIRISQKYFGFTQQDIASYSLQILDKCLQTYDGRDTLFTTYFTTVFSNKLREESQKLSTQKRKTMMYSSSLDSMVEDGFDIATYDTDGQMEELMEQLYSLGLDARELKYCNLLLQGYSNKEISEMFSTSIMTLSNIRKKLRLKLQPLHLEFT